MKKFFGLLFFSLGFFLFCEQAKALTISPLRYIFTVDTQKNYQVTLTIKNDGQKQANYKLVVLGASQENNGQLIFSQNSSPAENWVKPEQNFLLVEPQKEKKVNFNISIPGGVYPGFYYLGLGVEEINNDKEIGLSSRVVSILSLQVSGIAHESLNISRWQEKINKDKQKDISFSLLIENFGNVTLPLNGRIVIKNLRGKEIDSQPLVLGNELLPQTKRTLEPRVPLDKVTWPSLYNFEIQIKYGQTGQFVLAKERIWFLPLWFKLILSVLVIILFSVWFYFKKIRK